MDIESIGEKIDDIPVELTYRIIELFSGGLYSSPNKAFEELICNSYDAYASKVCVYYPDKIKKSDEPIIWVCDNGDSMNSDELKFLWRIGYSNKRSEEYEKHDRKQIGKFGIGKLATYLLTKKITYFCCKDNKIRAVTMDYDMIDKNKTSSQTIKLSEREITLKEVKKVLNPIIKQNGKKLLSFKLWGENAEKSWTFVILSELKPQASDIKIGRVKWLLSTALPLSPGFEMLFNGTVIESSKTDIEPIKTWNFGDNDTVVERYPEYDEHKIGEVTYINLPNLKNITGKMELYYDTFLGSKSERYGRSHGIFLLIRERLVNIDDPLLGMGAFSHGVFNRIRIIIKADLLDEELTSTRESIKKSPELTQLQQYIQRKFEEAKTYYFNFIETEIRSQTTGYRIDRISTGFTRKSILNIVKKYFSNKISYLNFIEIPSNLTVEEKEEIISNLETDMTKNEGFIKDVKWKIMNPDDLIAKYNVVERTVYLNSLHPFFVDYFDKEDVKRVLQLFSIAEILTEAFLYDSGASENFVKEIIWLRDQFLRDLARNEKPNLPSVIRLLQANLSDATGLEEALCHAFDNLGYETTHIGGKGKPDGLCVAYLGPLDPNERSRADYRFIFDAKSTSKKSVAAKDLNIAGVLRHKKKYNANFAIIIAKDFDGDLEETSAASEEADLLGVTLIRVKDLMTLLLIATPKRLGFHDFKDLLVNCHTPKETADWIETKKNEEIKIGPINELLEECWKMWKDDFEYPDLGAIRQRNKELEKCSKDELRDLILSINRIVGPLISIKGDRIDMSAPPERIITVLNSFVNSSDIPLDFIEVYEKYFKNLRSTK